MSIIHFCRVANVSNIARGKLPGPDSVWLLLLGKLVSRVEKGGGRVQSRGETDRAQSRGGRAERRVEEGGEGRVQSRGDRGGQSTK